MIDFSRSIIDVLPLPMAVVRDCSDTLNHPIVFLNAAFLKELGWTIKDIPDKDTWWEKAYPNPDYQTVVARQWELACETAQESDEHFVMMEVNIMTKHKSERRFRVFAEQSYTMVEGFYMLAFEPVS